MRGEHGIAYNRSIAKIPCVSLGAGKNTGETGGNAYDDAVVVAGDRDRSRIGRLIFISSHIDGAIGDAQVAVNISQAPRVVISAHVDASRAGLEMKIAAGLIHKYRRSSDVTDASGHWRAAVTVSCAISIGTSWRGIVVHDAIVKRATVTSAAVSRAVADQRAINQGRGPVNP